MLGDYILKEYTLGQDFSMGQMETCKIKAKCRKQKPNPRRDFIDTKILYVYRETRTYGLPNIM